jgi:uncharacterized protein YcnI
MKKSKAILIGVVGLTAMTTVAANAHVEFSPDSAPANKKVSLTIMVPHDCNNKTKTTEIKMQLPANLDTKSFVAGALYQSGKIVASWKQSILKSGGKNYLDIKGPALQAGPDMGKNAFTVKFGFTTPNSAGSQLKFPTVQYCADGTSTSWIQPRPANGAEPSEMSKPVPVLNLK